MITNIAFLNTTVIGEQVAAPPLSIESQLLENDTPMLGDILASNVPAPATPTNGLTRIYVDSTQKVLSAINDAGQVSRTVVPATAAAGQFMTGISNAGLCQFGVPALLPRNYIDGFIVTNDATSPNTVLDVSVGQATDSTNAFEISSSATFTKSTGGSWVAGSGANGMGTGLTISASTWYFAYVILTNTGAFDVYFDTSSTGANVPAGTTAFRMIYPFRTDGSSHILGVSQNGDEFLWNSTVRDVNDAAIPTSATLVSLTVPPIICNALFAGAFESGASFNTLAFGSPASGTTGVTTQSWGSLATNDSYGSAVFNVRTNASSQIYVYGAGSNLLGYNINTIGWVWRRGRQ